MPRRTRAPQFPPEPAPPLVTGGNVHPDNIAIPANLLYRCRNLSVWRDGPFLTFVIPTMHSRANLAADEAKELCAALGINVPKRTVAPKTGRTHKGKHVAT